MSKKSSIECELIFGEGLHRVNFDGNLQELSFISVLIINTIRSEYMDAGFTDEQTKGLLIGGAVLELCLVKGNLNIPERVVT